MNEIIISNINPQDIIIEGGGSTIGLTAVYVNGVDVTVGSVAYVIVPTKLSELENNVGFISHETDPTVPYYVKEITISDINSWNSKQDALVSGVNIKTINNNSILGSGNLNIDTSYTAGTGIEITEENVINNTITSYDDLTDLPTIPTKTSDLTNDSNFVKSSELNQVAFTGDYDDLTGTPTIPTLTSELENDSEFITNRVDDLINYYDKDFLFNYFPKVSGSGTDLSLNNTYPSTLKLTLSPSELSQDGTPTPSTPYPIHSTSGNNTIKVEGKNLVNANNIEFTPGSINWFGLDGIILNNPSQLTGTSIGVSVKANETYTFSIHKSSNAGRFQLVYVSGSNFSAFGSITTGTPVTFTPTADTIVYPRVEPNTTGTKLTCTLMLEKSSSETSYEPYNGNSYSVNLGSFQYYKIGNYSDRIFKNVEGDPDFDDFDFEVGRWYLKKNIGKVVLDGTQTYGYSNTYGGIYYSHSSIANVKATETGVMSNKALGQPVNNLINQNGIGQNNESNRIIIKFDGVSSYNTNELIKQYFASNNYDVYYVLATPIYSEITETLEDELDAIYNNSLSKSGQTNISQINNDLPFIIDAITLKDISNI